MENALRLQELAKIKAEEEREVQEEYQMAFTASNQPISPSSVLPGQQLLSDLQSDTHKSEKPRVKLARHNIRFKPGKVMFRK